LSQDKSRAGATRQGQQEASTCACGKEEEGESEVVSERTLVDTSCQEEEERRRRGSEKERES
jgi:hypothetical protein